MSKLFLYSDNIFRSAIRKPNGADLGADNVEGVFYQLLDMKDGNVLIEKTLNNGIEIVISEKEDIEKEYEITIDDSLMSMKAGLYWHRMFIYDLNGNKVPPIFNKSVEIE